MNQTLPIKDKNVIQQVKAYYRNRENYRDLLLFELAINSGMKLTDLLKLNVKDVSNVLKIKEGLELTFNDEIKDLIAKVTKNRKAKEPLFVTIFNNRIDRTGVHYNFKVVYEELGLKNVSYSLRKTFGYHYYKKYGDIVFLN